MSKITLNIVEPGSSTPVDPGINPAVPNTGLFTHGIGGPEATIITVSIVAVLAVVAAVLYYRKKHNKKSKLTDAINVVKSKKQLSIPLAALAMVVSLGTLAGLLVNAGKSNTNAVEGDTENSLTVTESSEDLTIEVTDTPVFAVLPVEVSVEEATAAGYTLTAYTDSTDLVSTTNPDNAIPMIAVEGDELEALTDNTYGLALEEPTSKDDEAYTTLSTDQSNPTIIKSMTDYTPTEAEDTTTIYYGFYITPNIPYGTYTGSDIYYDATINTTLVTFDGNGLYFNNDTEQTTNEVEYIAVPEEGKEYTINQIISGEYKEPSQDLPYIFLGWSTDSAATVPTYTSEQSIEEFLPILPNTPLTLYAVWQKATTITYDNNGGAGEMDKQTIIAGESDNLYPNEFTREGYHFTGWNTDTEGTGQSYADEANYTAPVTSQNLTLYAQWEEPPTDLTFTAGEHISTLIVADSLENWKPYYMSSGSSKTFTAPTEGTKYMVTVVPEPGYVLSSDATNSSYVEDFTTGTLASKTLLTTTYVAGSAGDNITISAALANTDDAHPAYASMQDLTVAQCPAYTDSAQGVNVTDERDNKSYAVAKFGNYCYMLSNIKVDGNTTLTPATSHVSSDYALPADTGSGGWTYNSCQPTVASVNGEYYYNWPAATARVNSTSSTSDCYNDTDNSIGDICPAGWNLPTYQDITPSDIWDNGANPSMLYTGGFWRGRQDSVGSSGNLWSSLRDSSYSAMWLNNFGTYVGLGGGGAKGNNQAVRCMRSS